jgi:hypothetical protein
MKNLDRILELLFESEEYELMQMLQEKYQHTYEYSAFLDKKTLGDKHWADCKDCPLIFSEEPVALCDKHKQWVKGHEKPNLQYDNLFPQGSTIDFEVPVALVALGHTGLNFPPWDAREWNHPDRKPINIAVDDIFKQSVEYVRNHVGVSPFLHWDHKGSFKEGGLYRAEKRGDQICYMVRVGDLPDEKQDELDKVQ